VFSAYIILEAARLGYSKRTLLRMSGNVAVDALVGVVPILGDMFDIAWRANVRNVALLRAHRVEGALAVALRQERGYRLVQSRCLAARISLCSPGKRQLLRPLSWERR
jgi:hypothetical protein